MGYNLHFISTAPFYPLFLSLFRDLSHEELTVQEVQSAHHIGAVEAVPQNFREGFLLLFPNAKRDLSPILDMHQLNNYLKKIVLHGHLGICYSLSSLDPSDWYTTLNLRDAYFHVSYIKGTESSLDL